MESARVLARSALKASNTSAATSAHGNAKSASAGRAAIAVVGTPSRSQKGWPVVRHVLDEPRGRASEAGQEDQRHLSADRQEHRRLDVDKSGCPAGLERHGKAVVVHATAAERRRGKDPITQTPVGRVDLGLPITA
jgi:hypothetical protein